MRSRRSKDRDTLDLFSDWSPPAVEVGFCEPIKPWASLDQALIARALSRSIRDRAMDRGVLCERMGALVGVPLSLNMLNNWCAESKPNHNISLTWALAFVIVTGDARLLSIGLEDSDFAIIERKYLPTIKRAVAQKQRQQLDDYIALLDKEEGRL